MAAIAWRQKSGPTISGISALRRKYAEKGRSS